MISFLRHWPIAIYVFYLCLIAPAVLACDALLDLKNSPSFVERGTLGNEAEYLQRVYSSQGVSYSTIVFPSKPFPNKKILLRDTIKQMVSTVKWISWQRLFGSAFSKWILGNQPWQGRMSLPVRLMSLKP